MHTTVKKCYYKDCNTKYGEGLALFMFPKDADRCKKWLDLSGNAGRMPLKKAYDYLCEKHFDPIYISSNPRRKILVGEAVPFDVDDEITAAEYPESVDVIQYEPEEGGGEHFENESDAFDADTVNQEQYIELDKCPARSEEDYEIGNDYTAAEAITIDEYDDHDEQVIEKNGELVNLFKITNPHKRKTVNSQTTDAMKLKRVKKIDESAIITNHKAEGIQELAINENKSTQNIQKSTKQIDASADQQQQQNNIQLEQIQEDSPEKPAATQENPADNLDLLKSSPDITTFIFRGEEYVQMPKATFDKFADQIQMYKSILLNLKGQLKDVC